MYDKFRNKKLYKDIESKKRDTSFFTQLSIEEEKKEY